MFLKLVGVVVALMFGGLMIMPAEHTAQLYYNSKAVGDIIVTAEAETTVDTFACPTPDAIFGYLSADSPDECSVLRWSDVQAFELLGEFPIIADYIDTEDYIAVASSLMVQVYRIKYDGITMFAIKDMLDEELLDGPTGRRPGVAYTVWEDGDI